MMDNTTLIFDIQRSSFVDGPGIRTVVFFKGCPLKCEWCHNPESQSINREILWYQNLCTGCNACFTVCKQNAIIQGNDQKKIDRSKCNSCGECVNGCNYSALKIAGQAYSIESLVEIILKDKTYFKLSGGGVTFSGGEPLMFMEYLSSVCKRLKVENIDIDIAIQTCGYFNFDQFEKIISPYINTIYFDLKLIDNTLHKKFTGQGNELILKNLQKLFSPKKHKICIRTPLVPGITDSNENLNLINEIISKLDHDGYEKLIYNDSFHKKAVALGRDF
ncbi:MAG: glycyl-radical enzyme activating protein [Mariniphaga sp.]